MERCENLDFLVNPNRTSVLTEPLAALKLMDRKHSSFSQSHKVGHCCQLCVPIYLQFLFLFVSSYVSKCEIRNQGIHEFIFQGQIVYLVVYLFVYLVVYLIVYLCCFSSCLSGCLSSCLSML